MASFLRALPLGIALLAAKSAATPSHPVAYCASINTGSTPANYSTYQSDGLCYTFCNDQDYALAIVLANNCWCGNYIPSADSQVSTDECYNGCPGFPSDVCGGDNLYGYMALVASPSGTSGASNTAGTATQGSASTTGSPSLSVATVTQGGSVMVQTVTEYPSVTADANAQSISSSPNGLSTGAAVGIAVGVLGAVVVVAAIAIFFCLRRRRRQKEQALVDRSNSNRGSSAGMMSTPRTEMASVWEGDAPPIARRNSRLMPHDPRMDPYAANIYSRFENRSRESVNTLRDDQDYSRRVLRTTNPDPEHPAQP